jgi:hypothetical protein
LAPLKSSDWFVECIRPLVWVVARKRMPKGHAEKRDDLLGLAARLRELWMDYRSFNHHVGDEFHEFTRELENEKDGYQQKRLLAAYYGDETLVWLAKYLEAVAGRLDQKKQPPKWRARERRRWRVWIALELMPVFEKSFGRKATLNKWPSVSGDEGLGSWADFYQRVMAATLGENVTPDLEGVLTEARKLLGASGYSPGDFLAE